MYHKLGPIIIGDIRQGYGDKRGWERGRDRGGRG